jgi:hypothetical protein
MGNPKTLMEKDQRRVRDFRPRLHLKLFIQRVKLYTYVDIKTGGKKLREFTSSSLISAAPMMIIPSGEETHCKQ